MRLQAIKEEIDCRKHHRHIFCRTQFAVVFISNSAIALHLSQFYVITFTNRAITLYLANTYIVWHSDVTIAA